MIESKYKVPKDARQFVASALYDAYGKQFEKGEPYWHLQVSAALQAFIKWQSENPPVPTEEQITDLRFTVDGDTYRERQKLIAVEWIRRMYLVPEPSDGQRSFSTPFGIFEVDDRVPPGEIRLYQWDGPTLVRNVGPSEPDPDPDADPPGELENLLVGSRAHMPISSDTFNAAVLEAFRRGQKSKTK